MLGFEQADEPIQSCNERGHELRQGLWRVPVVHRCGVAAVCRWAIACLGEGRKGEEMIGREGESARRDGALEGATCHATVTRRCGNGEGDVVRLRVSGHRAGF